MSTEAAPGAQQLSPWALPMAAAPENAGTTEVAPEHKDAAILLSSLEAITRQQYPVHAMYGPADGAMIPAEGPATAPNGPRTFTFIGANPAALLDHIAPHDQPPPNQSLAPPDPISASGPVPNLTESSDPQRSSQSPEASGSQGGVGANHYPSSSGVPRLPPILQVEKQQVTTSATQVASANRRRNEAHFQCPVPGCGSTFTRRFNLRGHLRSHTEERPYVCPFPDCKKGFARQHDCKRHTALHTAKPQANKCLNCQKNFSRLDALNRHLRSDGGADCKRIHEAKLAGHVTEDAGENASQSQSENQDQNQNQSQDQMQMQIENQSHNPSQNQSQEMVQVTVMSSPDVAMSST